MQCNEKYEFAAMHSITVKKMTKTMHTLTFSSVQFIGQCTQFYIFYTSESKTNYSQQQKQTGIRYELTLYQSQQLYKNRETSLARCKDIVTEMYKHNTVKTVEIRSIITHSCHSS